MTAAFPIPVVAPHPAAERAGSARRGPRGVLPVTVEMLPAADSTDGCSTFWALVGDLAADLLLDGTEGPWTPGVGPKEMIAP